MLSRLFLSDQQGLFCAIPPVLNMGKPLLDDLLEEIVNPPMSCEPLLSDVRIKAQPEDFCVEEIPTYLPDGYGEHLFLWVEKRDVSAGELVTQLGRRLKTSSRDIGVAGQKDRRAITRQFASVPRSAESLLSLFQHDAIRILLVSSHGNKLRTGHLKGNRFQIALRPDEGSEFSLALASSVHDRLQQLSESGFPNYFGPQRFGHNGSTLRDGLALLRGEPTPGHWKSRHGRQLKRLAISAVQSAVFNLVLAVRVQEGSFAQPQSGDIVCRRNGIRPFPFADCSCEDRNQVVPMGPMPGPKMAAASDHADEIEQRVMQRLGVSTEMFNQLGKLASGTRRKLVEYPAQTSASLRNDGSILTTFELPAGTYATVLLAEVAEY